MKKQYELIDAMELIDKSILPLRTSEKISLFDAVNRVLASDLACQKELPAFDNSGMDGYIIRLADVGKTVKIIGSIFAGDDASSLFLSDGECYKIMTGAMMPNGAQAVVPFEDAINIEGETVKMPSNIKQNQHIKQKGEEMALGEKVLKAGDILSAGAVSLLASQGVSYIDVIKRPKIGVLSTGNEIIEPWHKAEPHQIYNSNSSALISHLKSCGFDVSYIGILPDKLDEMKQKIEGLIGFDAIFTTGGVSVGEADFVERAFAECGMDVILNSVAVKPGKHITMGKMGDTYIFGLPGNPLSAIINLMYLITPYLFKLAGAKAYYLDFVYAKNTEGFKLSKGRANMVLGTLKSGEFTVTRGGKYGSGMIAPLVESNALIFTQNGMEEVKEGERVKIVPMSYVFRDDFINVINS